MLSFIAAILCLLGWRYLENDLIANLLFVAAVGLLLSGLPAPALSESIYACQVLDGDTFKTCGDDPITIRLWGADAPELKQPYGQESANFLADTIMGRRKLFVKVMGKSYSRLVCRVYLDSDANIRSDVSQKVISQGLAYADYKYSGNYYQYYQQEAIKRGLGVWPTPPWLYRSRKRKFYPELPPYQ